MKLHEAEAVSDQGGRYALGHRRAVHVDQVDARVVSGRRGRGDGADAPYAGETAADQTLLAPDLETEAPSGTVRAQGVNREQASPEENGHAVGHALDLAEDVRGHQDGEGSGE